MEYIVYLIIIIIIIFFVQLIPQFYKRERYIINCDIKNDDDRRRCNKNKRIYEFNKKIMKMNERRYYKMGWFEEKVDELYHYFYPQRKKRFLNRDDIRRRDFNVIYR